MYLLSVNFIGLFACLFVMGTNSNMKTFMKLMEGPIGSRIVPIVVLIAPLIVFGAPPPTMGLGLERHLHLTSGWEGRNPRW